MDNRLHALDYSAVTKVMSKRVFLTIFIFRLQSQLFCGILMFTAISSNGDTTLISSGFTSIQNADKYSNDAQQPYAVVIRALVDVFAQRLKTVVLFGSQARGDAKPESDHDLFVVIDNLPDNPLARQRTVRYTLLPILDQLPGTINFVAKTPAEVAANLTPLLLDVCVDGLCLYGVDYFEPYREQALAALHQSKLTRHRVGGTLMWLFPKMPTADWSLNWEGYLEYA